jgi:hypothetical protein
VIYTRGSTDAGTTGIQLLNLGLMAWMDPDGAGTFGRFRPVVEIRMESYLGGGRTAGALAGVLSDTRLDLHGEKPRNDVRASSADREARLYRKEHGRKTDIGERADGEPSRAGIEAKSGPTTGTI